MDPGSSGSGGGGSSGDSSSGANSGNSNNGSACDTIDLTMWRKRFVDVYVMEKANDDTFVAGVSFGDNIGKDSDAILPGGNGKTDTMILGGDDERDGEKVTSGDNGKVETRPNSGQGSGYYPSNAGNRQNVVETLRKSYANTNKPNHLAYIDFVVEDQDLQLPHVKQMECPDTTPPSTNNDWTQYIDKHVHGKDKSHADYIYDLIGISDFTGTVGNSTIDPHIGLGVQFIKTSPNSSPNEDFIHETGHNVLPEGTNIHDNHTGGPNDGQIKSDVSDCAYEDTEPLVMGIEICQNHIRMIRDNVTRSWPDHDTDPTLNPSEDENDSNE